MGKFKPTYLRIVVTRSCNYNCPYCHKEGDLSPHNSFSDLSFEKLAQCFQVAVQCGIKKFKLLGGEPLLRKDLPELIDVLKKLAPACDISIITAGAVPHEALAACYDAGLSRVNISIHGFTLSSFLLRNPNRQLYKKREQFIEAALAKTRLIKFNYVYSNTQDEEDLSSFLEWAAKQRVLVNVLDNLHLDLGPKKIMEVIQRLRGNNYQEDIDADADSLPTLHWTYSDGLKVEIKHLQLGKIAPFNACSTCNKKAKCKEGIVALRLNHQGFLLPCMDRQDLAFNLAEIAQDPEKAVADWQNFIEVL